MLGLWLWWFKWAGKNGAFYIFDLFWHLRMGEVLVNDDTMDQFSIVQFAADLKIY